MSRLLLFFQICLLLSTNFSTTPNELQLQQDGSTDYPITLVKSIDVVFIGFTADRINLDLLASTLPHEINPMYDLQFYSEYNLDLNLTVQIQYNYIFLDIIDEYKTLIKSSGNTDTAPPHLIEQYHNVTYVDAFMIQQYLSTLLNRTSVVIIDTYTADPDNYQPYFYNGSVGDYDTGQEYTRYYSQNEITGGGGQADFIWMDLAAGPINVFSAFPIALTENEVPPIWNYGDTVAEINRLSEDIGNYFDTGIRFTIVPSFVITPFSSTKAVDIQILLFNIDSEYSNYDDFFDEDHVLDEFKRINPYLEWSNQLINYDATADAEFMSVYQNALFPGTRLVNNTMIRNYIEPRLEDYFDFSPDKTVLPIIIYALPDNLYFDRQSGVAIAHLNGSFNYAYLSMNNEVATRNPEVALTHFNQTYELDAGESVVANITRGQVDVIIETHVSSNNTVDMRMFDNYQRVNSNLTNDAIESGSGTDIIFNTTLNVETQLFWQVNTTADTEVTIDITGYYNSNFGLTSFIIHELGHGVGLPHPHEGFVFTEQGQPNFIQNYLWGSILTPMAYYNDYSNFSTFDLISIQRGWVAIQLDELDTEFKILQDLIEEYGFETYFQDDLNQLESQVNTMIINDYNDTIKGYDQMMENLVDINRQVTVLHEEIMGFSPPVELPQSLRITNTAIIGMIVLLQVGVVVLLLRKLINRK